MRRSHWKISKEKTRNGDILCVLYHYPERNTSRKVVLGYLHEFLPFHQSEQNILHKINWAMLYIGQNKCRYTVKHKLWSELKSNQWIPPVFKTIYYGFELFEKLLKKTGLFNHWESNNKHNLAWAFSYFVKHSAIDPMNNLDIIKPGTVLAKLNKFHDSLDYLSANYEQELDSLYKRMHAYYQNDWSFVYINWCSFNLDDENLENECTKVWFIVASDENGYPLFYQAYQERKFSSKVFISFVESLAHKFPLKSLVFKNHKHLNIDDIKQYLSNRNLHYAIIEENSTKHTTFSKATISEPKSAFEFIRRNRYLMKELHKNFNVKRKYHYRDFKHWYKAKFSSQNTEALDTKQAEKNVFLDYVFDNRSYDELLAMDSEYTRIVSISMKNQAFYLKETANIHYDTNIDYVQSSTLDKYIRKYFDSEENMHCISKYLNTKLSFELFNNNYDGYFAMITLIIMAFIYLSDQINGHLRLEGIHVMNSIKFLAL
ncbi:hypothetical protein ACJA23_03010 [Mycoplasma corogypsi]|uniref:hypothetical protein n=1 Tax=Mycoplasma corogypsi TaxID=2106 RepID=UPI003873A6BF